MSLQNIIIADNQFLTREGTHQLIKENFDDLTIFEVFSSEELYHCIENNKTELLIIDYALFDFSGIDDFKNLIKTFPQLKIMILTDAFDYNYAKKLIDNGIKNYVLKSSEKYDIVNAIRALQNNKKYFCEEMLDLIMVKKENLNNQEASKLTKSEIEIVKMIAQGQTTKEIANNKNLSFHTIITHRKNIFRKLKINNTSELVMYAFRTGIIENQDYSI
jgi:DNA-binding NarL/FixJ family response regulator